MSDLIKFSPIQLNTLYLFAALPPTGPELANDKWRIQRRRKSLFDNRRNGTVTDIDMSTGADTLTYIFYICCHIEIKCGKKDSKNEFIFSVNF